MKWLVRKLARACLSINLKFDAAPALPITKLLTDYKLTSLLSDFVLQTLKLQLFI